MSEQEWIITKAESIEVTDPLQRLKTLSKHAKVLLLLIFIIGTSLLGASVVFRPHSMAPESLTGLKTQLDQLNAKSAQLQSDSNSLTGQITSLESQIADANTKASSLQSDISNLNNQLSQVHTDISSLQQQLSTTSSQLQSAQASLANAQQQLQQIQNSLQQANSNVQQFTSQLQQQQSALQSYSSNVNQAQSQHDSLLSQYNSEASTYNDRLNTYNQKLQDYNAELSKLKSQILEVVVVGIIAIAISALTGGGFTLGDVPTILSTLSGAGINVSQMMQEYNDLQQQKNWLDSENAWIQSESQQLQSLASQVDTSVQHPSLLDSDGKFRAVSNLYNSIESELLDITAISTFSPMQYGAGERQPTLFPSFDSARAGIPTSIQSELRPVK